MLYQQLRDSELHISGIGFGCMSLKGTQPQIERLLRQAVEDGVNYFDTADIYEQGKNEISVGKALRSIRKRVIIATKVGNQPKPDGNGFNWNASKEYILKAVDDSLRRLQTDYIDLYQLHGGTLNDPFDDTIEAFELLQKAGKIRYYGISSIRPNVIREWVRRSHPISVMMQYSLLDRRPEEECFSLLKANNIGVLARGSVAGGLLVDKPAKDYLNRDETEVKAAVKAAHSIITNERSAAQSAIEFVLANPAVASAVVGIRTPEQLKDATNAIADPLLSASDVEKLREVVAASVYEEHR